MSPQKLHSWLLESIPIAIFRWLILSNTVKNCNNLSHKFAALSQAKGFKIFVVSETNHFYNVAVTNKGMIKIDLTAIQFNLSKWIPDNYYEDHDPYGELIALDRLFQVMFPNPFLGIIVEPIEIDPKQLLQPVVFEKTQELIDGHERMKLMMSEPEKYQKILQVIGLTQDLRNFASKLDRSKIDWLLTGRSDPASATRNPVEDYGWHTTIDKIHAFFPDKPQRKQMATCGKIVAKRQKLEPEQLESHRVCDTCKEKTGFQQNTEIDFFRAEYRKIRKSCFPKRNIEFDDSVRKELKIRHLRPSPENWVFAAREVAARRLQFIYTMTKQAFAQTNTRFTEDRFTDLINEQLAGKEATWRNSVVAARRLTLPCDKCGATGNYDNGGNCFRCEGKGQQTYKDAFRNLSYDKWKKMQAKEEDRGGE